jgi:AMMECR1 domain-containing protein
MTLPVLQLCEPSQALQQPPCREQGRVGPSTPTGRQGGRRSENSIPPDPGIARLLRRRNNLCSPRAALILLLHLVFSDLALAQPSGSVTPDDAMAAYRTLDAWVRQWRIGEREAIQTPGAPAAVAIVLRCDGRIVGRGCEPSAAPDSLRRAAGQALAEATERLPIDHDALYEQSRRALAERVTISLELAAPLTPFAPAEYTDAAGEVSPGIDGVAARFGDRIAVIFPSLMLTTGMDGPRALAAAVAQAAADPAKSLVRPADLAAHDGAVFYRFRVTHLAQLEPRTPPVFLHRGGKIATTADLDLAFLERWAGGLADNLIARLWPGEERFGLQGTYDPVTGVYETTFAPPADQALAITALHACREVRAGDPARLDAAIRALADDLAAVEPGETPPWEDLAAAALIAALPPDPALAQTAERCRAVIEHALDDAGAFANDIPDSVRPLLLFGLALATRPGDPSEDVARRLRAGVQACYRSIPPGKLVTAMPWLGFADVAVTRLERRENQAQPDLRSAVALRDMRELVWRNQLKPDALPPEQRDLAGGIVFTAARNPLPSWQSARPMAFIAAMLGDPRLTEPQEVPAELARLLASLRFLRQLSAGEAESHMYVNPARAMWGVRLGPWDQRMPVDATALTLITVCRTLRSLEQIRRQGP